MYYIKIKKNFVHQVGNQPRLYYNARSTNHQEGMVICIETGMESFWVTCRLVSCCHIVLGHAVAGDIS